MKKAKIVSFYGIPLELQSNFLRGVNPSTVDLVVASRDLPEDEICETIRGATMVLNVPRGPYLDRRMLEAARGVKLIQFLSVGYERIDLDAATELGIPVANNAGFNSVSVAEHAIMMILVLLKRAFHSHDRVIHGEWPDMDYKNLWELRGRTLGILGLGRIGTEVARIARAFGARILYNKRSRLSEEGERELGVEYRSFEDLLMESDILTVHTPLTEETRGMIGREEIASMKDGAMLVNTARGGIVDEAALAEALGEGKLHGVGLDVPPLGDDRAAELEGLFSGVENVILTPHIASATNQAGVRFFEQVAANVARVLGGERPLYLVNDAWR